MDGAAENIIRHDKCVFDRLLTADQAEQVLIGNNDQRIDRLSEFFNARFGRTHFCPSFKVKGLGNNADR